MQSLTTRWAMDPTASDAAVNIVFRLRLLGSKLNWNHSNIMARTNKIFTKINYVDIEEEVRTYL